MLWLALPVQRGPEVSDNTNTCAVHELHVRNVHIEGYTQIFCMYMYIIYKYVCMYITPL